MFPTPELAVQILEAVIGPDRWAASRFPTGTSHFVFDAASVHGERLVVRISSVAQTAVAANAVRLTQLLRPLGVPLPDVIHADFSLARFPYPYVILERLPGVDLGDVYLDLTVGQKQAIAREMVRISAIVRALPPGHGFGFGADHDDPTLRPTWRRVVEELVERAEDRFPVGDRTLAGATSRVRSAIAAASETLASIEPRPFLHDTTTKNVMVHAGRVSGIVDVDDFCFGDRLFTPGLTWASLLARGWPADYVDPCWTGALALDSSAKQRLRLYAACFCIDLLGELGQTFGDRLVPTNDLIRARLLEAVSTLLGER